MSDFLAMGGYAFYVWTAYGIFAVALIGLFLGPLLRHRSAYRRMADRLDREEQRKNRYDPDPQT